MQRIMWVALLFLLGCSYVPTRRTLSLQELRRQNTILQGHQYSCGAAALATLMAMMGKPQTEQEVLELIFSNNLPMTKKQDGTWSVRALNLADLELGARALGFKAVSARAPSGAKGVEVVRALKPAIVRLRLYGDMLHFVLIRDVEEGWVYLSDPGYGDFRIPWTQFYDAWDAGDRILVTISNHPFDLWRDGSRTYLKRSTREPPPTLGDSWPTSVYRAAARAITQLGTPSR